MGTIKLRRGSGSPAGSLAQYEVAMDVADKNLYVSTDGSDAVILADNTENFLGTNTTELDITSDIDLNDKSILNAKQIKAEAVVYNEVSTFNRLNQVNNYAVASIELERDMTNSALSTGLDERGAGLSFTIKQDALTTPIYPGIFFGKSGGSAQSALVENTVGMSVYSGPNDSPAYSEIPVFDANRNNATVYPKLNTEKGIKNVADNYGEIAAFESKTLAPANTVGIELQRNLSTDGAVSGRDARGVAQLYGIYSDSGNTNGSATAIYPGGFVGQSGSNDGTSPHWLKAFTYDNGISSFSEETIWEGTKDEFHVYPPTEFHDTIQLNSASSDPVGVDGMMYYNSSTNQFRIKANGLWGDVDSTVTSTTLAALTDVDITSPANGQALVYNSATSKWENAIASTNTVMTMKTKVQLGSYTGTIGEKVLCTDAVWDNTFGEWVATDCVWLTQNSTSTWWRVGTGGYDQQVEFNLINIGECVNGQTYTIKDAYGSDFTLIGAANNNAGTVFTATGPGTGNGQCYT